MAVWAGHSAGRAGDRGFRDQSAAGAVAGSHVERAPDRYTGGSDEFEQMVLAEVVEAEQHFLARRDALLAAAHLAGGVVERVPPEAVSGDVVRVGADPVDAEVAERKPCARPREPSGQRRVIEC